MFSFRSEWLSHDPDWLERAPELRDDFQQMRQGFQEWNFLAVPVMLISALLFIFAIALLGHK